MAAAPKFTEGASGPSLSEGPNAAISGSEIRPDGRDTLSNSYDGNLNARLMLRAGALLIVIFQLAYMAEDFASSSATFPATRGLHLFNIVVGVLTFVATFTPLVPRYWRETCVTICAVLILSTARMGVDTRTVEPLFISIVALVIGVGTLAPWEGGWQASIGWVGVISFYLLESSLPGRDPHAFMHWIGLLMVIAVAQAQYPAAEGLSKTNRGED